MSTSPCDYSVFASYNSSDQIAVCRIVQRLLDCGVPVWMDLTGLPPGSLWQSTLETEITRSRVALIFFGAHGIGRWQQVEIDAILEQQANGHCTVIPVLLRGGEVPLLYRRFTWVDCGVRKPDPIQQLLSGIEDCNVVFSVQPSHRSMAILEWALIAAIILTVIGVSYWSPAQSADDLPAQATNLDSAVSEDRDPIHEPVSPLPDDIGHDHPAKIVHVDPESELAPPRLLPESPKWNGDAAVTHTAPDAAALIEQALRIVDSIPMAPQRRIFLVDPVW